MLFQVLDGIQVIYSWRKLRIAMTRQRRVPFNYSSSMALKNVSGLQNYLSVLTCSYIKFTDIYDIDRRLKHIELMVWRIAKIIAEESHATDSNVQSKRVAHVDYSNAGSRWKPKLLKTILTEIYLYIYIYIHVDFDNVAATFWGFESFAFRKTNLEAVLGVTSTSQKYIVLKPYWSIRRSSKHYFKRATTRFRV